VSLQSVGLCYSSLFVPIYVSFIGLFSHGQPSEKAWGYNHQGLRVSSLLDLYYWSLFTHIYVSFIGLFSYGLPSEKASGSNHQGLRVSSHWISIIGLFLFVCISFIGLFLHTGYLPKRPHVIITTVLKFLVTGSLLFESLFSKMYVSFIGLFCHGVSALMSLTLSSPRSFRTDECCRIYDAVL